MATAVLSHLSAAPPATKPRTRFYRPELDLLRFLAFLMVFFHHAIPPAMSIRFPFLSTPVMAASGGMCVFFLLSAYLITELLLREREKTGRIQLKSFYIRRALRIWPLYYLVLFGCLIASPWSGLRPDAFAAFALLGGNWFCYVNGWVGTGVAAVLWSISIEEQFYLLVPTLFRFGGRRALVISSVAFILLAYVTLGHLGGSDHLRQLAWTHTLVQFQFFALGTLVALALHGRELRIPLALRPILAIAGLRALCYSSDIAYQGASRNLIVGYLFLAIGALCLFFSLYGMPVPRFANPLIYLGRISYGLYVYHFMIIALVAAGSRRLGLQGSPAALSLSLTLELAVTVAVAALSFRFLETPFLRLKERFTTVPSQQPTWRPTYVLPDLHFQLPTS